MTLPLWLVAFLISCPPAAAVYCYGRMVFWRHEAVEWRKTAYQLNEILNRLASQL